MITFLKKSAFLIFTSTLLVLTCGLAEVSADADADPFANLELVEESEMAAAYIDPAADFGVFERVMLLDTYVSFRSGWDRDQRRGTSGLGVSARDVERIRTRVSELFNSVMVETLEANDGYEVVSEADYDVLLVRAAIIDLDVTAPDTMSATRSRTFTAESGAATLYIELYDSVSGQIIGRAIDRRAARSPGSTMRWTNRASNTADARRVFRGWADSLRNFLDAHYSDQERVPAD